jgi:hypothetical protein
MSVVRQIGGWAGMRVARRLARTFPIVGTAIAVAFVARAVRRKGWTRGLLDSTLDAMPVVGTVKAGVELFRGDLFPELDRPAVPPARSAVR